MNVNRRVHAVGQGAFYTEIISIGDNKYNIIYDCGSSTVTRKALENKIKNQYDKGEDIEALFISHFHEDHINGIKFLLKYCNVKHVFLPLLDEFDIALYKMYYCDQFSFEYGLVVDPIKAIHKISDQTYIHQVRPITNDEVSHGDDSDIQDNIMQLDYMGKDLKEVESGTKICLEQNCVWVCIPSNYENDMMRMKILLELQKRKIDIGNVDEDNFEEITQVYKSVLGKSEQNIYSLVLYSGPICQQKFNINCYTYGNNVINNYRAFFSGNGDRCIVIGIPYFNMGAVYVGDLKLKDFHQIQKARVYDCVKDNVGFIQIPHHGSKDNFDEQIFGIFPMSKIYFACAGINNSYGHPSQRVLDEIIAHRKKCYIVTEDINSELIIEGCESMV